MVFASRRAGDDWFCFEQPDRDGAALATLGCVARLDAPAGAESAARRGRAADDAGRARFTAVAGAWRQLAGDAITDAPDGPAGAGLVAVGGFPFAPGGADAPHWAGFGPGGLVVPEVALARGGRDVRLTVAALADPDDVPEELVARVERRLAGLRDRPLPLLDPAPSGRFRIASTAPPEHYEAAVARAVERIRARRVREDRARPRGRRCTRRRRMTPPRCSACCGRASAPASCTAPAAATPRSSVRHPSCWCAARACAPRRWRWPARRAARPTPPSTPISASSCCSRARTARSRTSSRAGSPARCGR